MTYRLTYEDVEDMLANGIAGSGEEWELGRLDELANLRYRSGAGKTHGSSANTMMSNVAGGGRRHLFF